MITHLSETRGRANHGWLKSFHTFSFADYYNPERMNFGALRVLNDDSVDPNMGFGMHPHKDMEIITIPLEGVVEHKDSMGNSGQIKKGEVQVMSAGTGVRHSEMNPSKDVTARFLQIWVIPNRLNVEPRYEQKDFSTLDKNNKFITVVSPDGREGSLKIWQNAFFSLSHLQNGKSITYEKKSADNGLYVFIISGEVDINGETFSTRDGVGIENFDSIEFSAHQESEILLMEVPL